MLALVMGPEVSHIVNARRLCFALCHGTSRSPSYTVSAAQRTSANRAMRTEIPLSVWANVAKD
jgi:hypothetical protein